MKKTIIAIMSIVSISSCGLPQRVDSGIVIEKKVSHSIMGLMGDSYYIRVVGYNQMTSEMDGDQWKSVSLEEYGKLNNGSKYPIE